MTETITQAPSYSKREAFLRDERANQIRNICLDIARNIDALLHDGKIATDQVLRYLLQESTNRLRGELISLGVTDYMHVGRTDDMTEASPIDIAEFTAGQLMVNFNAEDLSETEMMPIVQEYAERSSSDQVSAHLVTKKNSPDCLIQYFGMRDIVNKTFIFLDASPDESRGFREEK